MYIKKYSVKNQQKIVVGILNSGFYRTFKWFNKFASSENTIVKIQLSSIDIEKVFKNSLFFKNDIEETCFEECTLEDIIDWNIFIPNQVTNTMLGHPIILKRYLTHDDLQIYIYCFKGTLKAIENLLKYNNLQWSSKANRTETENQIINRRKYQGDLTFFDIRDSLIKDLDYEVIEKIFDVETMELLLEDDEVPFKELIAKRLIEFTESQDMDSRTFIEDYNW